MRERLGDSLAAWRALDVARRSLAVLEAAPEVAAVVADMARVSPQPFAVKHICFEAGKVIAGTHPLAEPLGSLASASREGIHEASSMLWQAAAAIVPCPQL